MELRQLAVVVAVAEEGGFTAAAQRLRTVQSTVSTVVRALERDLGTPLFHRTTHRVVLTPAGEAFVPAARAALEAAERARAAVSPVDGRVRLGVCPGLLADLHRVLTRLRHTHPGLEVEVRQVRPEEVGCGLRESLVDVAVILASGDSTAGSTTAGHPGACPAAGPPRVPGDSTAESTTAGHPSDCTAAGPARAPGEPAAGSTTSDHAGACLAAGPARAPGEPTAGSATFGRPGDSLATGPARAPGEPAAGSTTSGHAGACLAAGPARAHGNPTAESTTSGHANDCTAAGPAGAPGVPAAGSTTPGHRGACPAAGPARAPGDSTAEPVITPLCPEELVLATAPGGSRSAPADLSALSLVDFPPGWAIREAVDLAFPHRRISLEVDDLAVAAGLVRAGLAACVLPASVVARFPELTARRFDRPVPWQLAAVHRAEAGPAVAAVLAQLG